ALNAVAGSILADTGVDVNVTSQGTGSATELRAGGSIGLAGSPLGVMTNSPLNVAAPAGVHIKGCIANGLLPTMLVPPSVLDFIDTCSGESNSLFVSRDSIDLSQSGQAALLSLLNPPLAIPSSVAGASDPMFQSALLSSVGYSQS